MQGGPRVHGNLGTRTADAFEKAGVPILLANPFRTEAMASVSVKNDKVDAGTLARLLRSNLVAECHIGIAESRGIKQVFRCEMDLVQELTGAINSLHSLLDKYDEDPRRGGRDMWRPKALKYLDGLRLDDPADQLVLERHVLRIRYLNGELGLAKEEIRRYAKTRYGAKLLVSMTGIDVFATSFLRQR